MTELKENYIPEWSHMVASDDIGDRILRLSIEPDEEQKQALARRLDLVSLDSLHADLELKRVQGGQVVHVSGALKAHVTQTCVVSTDPVQSEINESFEGWYADPAQAVSLTKVRHDKEIERGKGERPILEERDDPEPMVDGQIDLGELVAQHLSLLIEPYPHAPGVHYEHGDDESRSTGSSSASETRKNPFEALKNWKFGKE